MNARKCRIALFAFAVLTAIVPQRVCAQQLAPDANSVIAQLVDHLSVDTIITFVRGLQAFGTRYEFTPQRDSAASYLVRTMTRFGYSPEIDQFTYSLAEYTNVDVVDQTSQYVIGMDTRNQQNIILRSTDGGRNWIVRPPPVVSTLTAIDFVDSLEGWVAGSGGSIFHSTDGALSWELQGTGTNAQMLDVSFFDKKLGVAVGERGALLITRNGGGAWNPVVWGDTNTLRKCRFIDARHIWVVGDAGVMMYSTDGGTSWLKSPSGISSSITSFDFVDTLHGWAVGPSAIVLKTIDGGASWGRADLPGLALRVPDSKMQDIAAISNSSAMALMEGEIWQTTDEGSTWRRMLGAGTHRLRKIDAQTLLTFGGYAGIQQTTDGGVTWRAWDQAIPRAYYGTSENIIATISGVNQPEAEYVVMAHYDSPQGTDPGADNNGSGVAVMLEMMRLLRYRTFGSTIKFVATSGKETGELGSNRFVSQAILQFRDVKGVINLDMVGYPVTVDTARCVMGSFQRRAAFVDSAVVFNTRYAIGMKIQAPVELRRDGDVYPCDVAKIAAVQISEGSTAEILSGNPYYLKPSDTFDKLSRGMLLGTAKLTLSLVAEFASPVTGQPATIAWKSPVDQWPNLRAIHVVDYNVAYVVGDAGTILKTTNGGYSWKQQVSGTLVNLNDVCFIDSSRGFVVGQLGTILRTTNGGTLWTKISLPNTSSVIFTSVRFSSSMAGTIVGDYGSIYQTSDGGVNWEQRIVTPFMSINAITYADKSNGYFVGSLGTIYGTKDGGDHWHRLVSGIESPEAVQLLDVSFSDADHGTVVGEQGVMLRTTNGGATWFRQQSTTRFHLRGVQFVDANIGFVCGDQGLLLGTTDGGSSWTGLGERLTSFLTALRFASKSTGYLVGSEGTLMKTTDGGSNWTYQSTGPRVPLYGVRFLTQTKGIVVGYQGFMYQTADGGTTWKVIPSGTVNDLRGIDFQDDMTGVVIGDLGTMLRTTDGGLSWKSSSWPNGYGFNSLELMPSGSSFIVGRRDSAISQAASIKRSLFLRSADAGKTWAESFSPWGVEFTAIASTIGSTGGVTLVAVGESGYIARSLDGGVTWNLIAGVADTVNDLEHATTVRLNGVTSPSSDVFVAIGENGTILRSLNKAGKWSPWAKMQSGTTNTLKSIWSMNYQTVAVGVAGAVLVSYDGGVSWSGIPTAAVVDLNAVHFTQLGVGTIVGDKGTILRTVQGGATTRAEFALSQTQPSIFALAQNYPNPFNSQTTIEFTISKAGHVALELFDVLGREIAVLVDEIKPQGTYRVRWNGGGLPSGVYFCRMSVGDGATTRKLILLK